MVTDSTDMTFKELKSGKRATIIGYARTTDFTDRLMEMGLTPGTSFDVLSKAPMGGPTEIFYSGSHIAVGMHESESILVKILN